GQERVPSRYLGRPPIELPSSPGMLIRGVDELRLRPGSATIGTDADSGDLGLARPRRAGDRKGRVGGERFVDPGASDLGLHLDLPQRTTDRLPLDVVPVRVVGGLPVALKRLTHGPDPREPLDRRHAEVTGNDRADGIPMILA